MCLMYIPFSIVLLAYTAAVGTILKPYNMHDTNPGYQPDIMQICRALEPMSGKIYVTSWQINKVPKLIVKSHY